ncbi:MAG: polyamine aminopropyltransferase [Flammeovirgaceae bacterium]|nr:polyamine aminopropyltransferase [Flammeovirgaceae bacterium]
MLSKSATLKLSLFATGLSGIVAEYILSTLATYFLGDSVFQWTIVLSLMLFSMGVGSRVSKFFDEHLLATFISIEFLLSLLVSFCALFTYTIAAYTEALPFLIYGLSIAIGTLIGMEIPLVIRLNDHYETLKVNISGAMEKDYYGSLLGGIFFAFIGLPYLGLTYTPYVLGIINFSVAIVLMLRLNDALNKSHAKVLRLAAVGITLILASGATFADSIVLYGEQKRYKDKVVYQDQSAYQRIVVTQWKEHFWLYLNGNQQLSTFDEWLYHEPMAHPAMMLHPYPTDVLILGGGDGALAREVLKYSTVKKILLVDLDKKVTDLCANFPPFVEMNKNALKHPKVCIINEDAYTFLERTTDFFDIILIDFPDPKTIELSRLFSYEFYRMCYRQLRPYGVLVAQAGSPYFTAKAFYCIEKTIQQAGFATLPMHNHVLTLGEWGWILAAKDIPSRQLKPLLLSKTISVPTRWLTPDALPLITSFGNPIVKFDSAAVEINTLHNPVLVGYYEKGLWDFY